MIPDAPLRPGSLQLFQRRKTHIHDPVIAPPLVLERELFIDNAWRPSSTGANIFLVIPATEKPFGRAAAASRCVELALAGDFAKKQPNVVGVINKPEV